MRIVIDLERAGAQPEGELTPAGQAPRRFSGWLALVSALEGAIGDGSARSGELPRSATPGPRSP